MLNMRSTAHQTFKLKKFQYRIFIITYPVETYGMMHAHKWPLNMLEYSSSIYFVHVMSKPEDLHVTNSDILISVKSAKKNDESIYYFHHLSFPDI